MVYGSLNSLSEIRLSSCVFNSDFQKHDHFQAYNLQQLFITFLLSALAIFLQIPVLVTIPAQLIMLTMIFIFSDKLLGDAFPDAKHTFCRLQHWDDDICFQARDVVKSTIAYSATFSVLIG